jgi:hypothetical protein
MNCIFLFLRKVTELPMNVVYCLMHVQAACNKPGVNGLLQQQCLLTQQIIQNMMYSSHICQ